MILSSSIIITFLRNKLNTLYSKRLVLDESDLNLEFAGCIIKAAKMCERNS